MKKKGFTLIEVVLALAVFLTIITSFYRYSGELTKGKIKNIKTTRMENLNSDLLLLIQEGNEKKFETILGRRDKVKQVYRLKGALRAGEKMLTDDYPNIKSIVEKIELNGIPLKDIKVTLELEKVVVEYQQNFETVDELGNGRNAGAKYQHLAFFHFKKVLTPSGEVDQTKINPFLVEPDIVLKGVLTLRYKINGKEMKNIKKFISFIGD